MVTRALLAIVLVLPGLLLSSCGDSDEPGPGPGDTTPPTITSRSVTDGATGVGLIERLEVTFSEDMDPATVSDTTLFVSGRGPAGFVEYDPATHTASVLPDTLRVAESPHRLVVTDDVTDEAGNPLALADTTDFETGPFDCDHLRDYLDPNETPATAANVGTDHVYHTLAICGDDHDVYAFTLTEPRKVIARTFIAHADSVGWQIHLMREDGQLYSTVGSTAESGETESADFTFLPGTYYADIFSYDHPVYVLYDLELETTEPCEDDQYEDNDFIDEATPVSAGTVTGLHGCSVDQDIFSIHLETGELLTATTTVDPYHGYEFSRLVIMNSSGAWLAWHEGTAETNTASASASQAGTYYVSAMFWANGVRYSLTLDKS